jgi:adenylate kinase family enzyme
MRKVVVFGNIGGGKTTLGMKLSASKNIPLYCTDRLHWRPGWIAVPDDEFERRHDEILAKDRWIIDGFGTPSSDLRRLEAADTIIFIDHSLWRHYWWAAKRSLLSMFRTPAGMPDKFPLIRNTVVIAKWIWRIHKNITPTSRETVAKYAGTKKVYHLRSRKEIESFCEEQSL